MTEPKPLSDDELKAMHESIERWGALGGGTYSTIRLLATITSLTRQLSALRENQTTADLAIQMLTAHVDAPQRSCERCQQVLADYHKGRTATPSASDMDTWDGRRPKSCPTSDEACTWPSCKCERVGIDVLGLRPAAPAQEPQATRCQHGKGDPPMDCSWPDCEPYCAPTSQVISDPGLGRREDVREALVEWFRTTGRRPYGPATGEEWADAILSAFDVRRKEG